MKFRIHWKLVVILLITSVSVYGADTTTTGGNDDDFVKTLREIPKTSSEGQSTLAEDPDWPFDVFVSAGGSHRYYAERSSGTAMYGSFTSSIGIDFFICDQANWDLWDAGQTAYVYELSYNVGSKEWQFIVPHHDTWYKVYDNTDNLFNQAHVVGTHRLDITEPVVSWNLVDGQSYTGTVDITVSASDEGFGVYDIQLYIDNALVDYAFDDSLSYSWITTDSMDGEYNVRVEVTDGANHLSVLEVDVNVSNISSIMGPAILIGAGAVVLIGVVFVLSKKMKSSEQVHQSPVPVERVEAQTIRFCPTCGAVRQPEAGYCSNCGTAFPK